MSGWWKKSAEDFRPSGASDSLTKVVEPLSMAAVDGDQNSANHTRILVDKTVSPGGGLIATFPARINRTVDSGKVHIRRSATLVETRFGSVSPLIMRLDIWRRGVAPDPCESKLCAAYDAD